MSKPPVQQLPGQGVLHHHHHHQLSQGSGGSSQLWICLQLKTFPQVVVNFLWTFSREWCRNVTFDEVTGNWMLSGSTTPVNCFRRTIHENESALLLQVIITYNQSRCQREYTLIISLSFSIPLPGLSRQTFSLLPLRLSSWHSSKFTSELSAQAIHRPDD